MKFNKKVFLSSLLACLSVNSCHSMEDIKNFFNDPVNASIASAGGATLFTVPVAYKIGSFFQDKKSKKSTKELKENCDTMRALRDESLQQNNFLASRNTQQQREINELTKENESLKEEVKYYKGLFSDIFGAFNKFSDCVIGIKNKICKSDKVASENSELEKKVQQNV